MSDLDILDDFDIHDRFAPHVRMKARRHMRGETQKTCFRGHPLTPENTNCYRLPTGGVQRKCKKCARLAYLEKRARRS